MRAANAAAMALRVQPAYISYRTVVHAVENAHVIDDTLTVTIRTADGRAIMRYGDGERAQIATEVAAAPGVPVTFDFLADFFFSYDFTGAHAALGVGYDRNRTFQPTQRAEGTNVVVASVRGYTVRYADAEQSAIVRLALQRLDGIDTRRDPVQTFLGFANVDFTEPTALPTRVAFAGRDNALTAEYTVLQGVPILTHLSFTATTYDARKRATTSSYDARYSDVTFSDEPPA